MTRQSPVLGCALAVILLHGQAALGTTFSSAVSVLVEGLQPAVAEFMRPVYVYHYAPRANVGLPARGFVPPDDPRVGTYLRRKALLYWDERLPIRPDGMMPGLYVAVDPIASRAFGGVGGDWALVRIVLRDGFRYVDVRGSLPAGSPAAIAFARAVQQVGCTATQPSQLFLSPASDSCRQLALETVAYLDVDAVLYSYRAAPLRGCRERPEAAFLLLGDEVFDSTDAAVFVTETKADEYSAERARINSLFERARDAGSTREPLWTTRGRRPSSKADVEFEVWMHSALFACAGTVDDAPLTDRAWRSPVDYWTDQLAARPESVVALFRLAKYELIAGRAATAIDHLRQLLAHDPEAPQVVEALALALTLPDVATSTNRDEAARLAAHLIEISHYRLRLPSGGYRWSWIARLRHSVTFARVGLAAGRFDQALGYAQQAYEAARARHGTASSPAWLERISVQSRDLAEQIERRRAESTSVVR